MNKKKSAETKPQQYRLPKDAIRRINLGQSFAEYDKVLREPSVFVQTPALLAAQEASRSKSVFVGRRGTGKTAITIFLKNNRRNSVVSINPLIMATLCAGYDLTELRNPHSIHFGCLVECFVRAIVDEVLAERIRLLQTSYQKFPSTLNPERTFIESHDFDLRLLAFVEDIFDALKKKDQKQWLKQKKRAGQVLADAESLFNAGDAFLVLIDKVDESWDGSDASVCTLMALTHACIQLTAKTEHIRPMLFLRENVFQRVREIDTEFSRIETSVVSLDWTKEQLLEFIERRLQASLNPKPPLGGTWDQVFEATANGSSYEYVFEHCQHRPRDILTYCDFALDSAKSSLHERVLIEDLHSAKRRFSESRFKDLGDEYSENYPQIQLVLHSFHGLCTEYTVAAIAAFIQKLLADAEVSQFCKSWFPKVTAPQEFISLLYSIGFVGIRNSDVTEFRGVGVRSSSIPPLSQSSIIVVHPTYHAALDLQNKLLGSLDDIVLQKEGLLIDLPEGIDLTKYQQELAALLDKLNTTPMGQSADEVYEEIVGDIIRLCFFRWLTNVEPKVHNANNRVIRDWIASNVAEQGFWSLMKDKFGANQVIWECKNYAKLSADDFHQSMYYMNNAIGKLVVMCFRGEEIESHYYQHIERIHTQAGGFVLLLRDKDLKVFLRQAQKQKVKEEHIRMIFDETIRKIS